MKTATLPAPRARVRVRATTTTTAAPAPRRQSVALTANNATPVATRSAPRHETETSAVHFPQKPDRPVYSPLGFKLFYRDDPNFRITNEDINQILYGQP
jgi:hypothetical protein